MSQSSTHTCTDSLACLADLIMYLHITHQPTDPLYDALVKIKPKTKKIEDTICFSRNYLILKSLVSEDVGKGEMHIPNIEYKNETKCADN